MFWKIIFRKYKFFQFAANEVRTNLPRDLSQDYLKHLILDINSYKVNFSFSNMKVGINYNGKITYGNLKLEKTCNDRSGGAAIWLGGVKVLDTKTEFVDGDIKRVIKEIENGTLEVSYDFNRSLIPFVEMRGEREDVAEALRKHFAPCVYNETFIEKNRVVYAANRRARSEVTIGRRAFNSDNSFYFIDVGCHQKPSNELFKRLDSDEVLEKFFGRRSWGNEKSPSGLFLYYLGYDLPTRTKPKKVASTLTGAADRLIKILGITTKPL
jgi:hypothetical protein